MKIIALILTLITTIGLQAGEKNQPVFYCGFENMEEITALGGKASTSAVFVKGVKGNALDLKDNLGCFFPSNKAVPAKEGTLSAWIRPNWKLRNLKSSRRRIFAVVNKEQKTTPVHLHNYFCILGHSYGQIDKDIPYQLYCLIRETKQEQGLLLIPEAAWDPEKWQHITVSWRIGTGIKNGEFKFYLNGEMLGRRTDFRAVKIAMGKQLYSAPGGVLDELKVWDRILSEDEIKSEFSKNKSK
jgi:concanavalin A-like lectin/glucanase superfamily protein